jgi:hypothetical protein
MSPANQLLTRVRELNTCLRSGVTLARNRGRLAPHDSALPDCPQRGWLPPPAESFGFLPWSPSTWSWIVGRMSGPSDSAVVSALSIAAQERPDRWGNSYAVRVVGMQNHRVDLEVRQGGDTARVWLALPSSGRPMPWVMSSSTPDAGGWVRGLLDWLDEEMGTGGIATRAIETDTVGVTRMVVEGYGLRSGDLPRHARLRRAVGPNGWGPSWVRERGRRRIRRLYALEWALDEVEAQVANRPASVGLEPIEPRHWDLVSPEGVGVRVDATASDAGNPGVDLRATTDGRLSHKTASRSLSPLDGR